MCSLNLSSKHLLVWSTGFFIVITFDFVYTGACTGTVLLFNYMYMLGVKLLSKYKLYIRLILFNTIYVLFTHKYPSKTTDIQVLILNKNFGKEYIIHAHIHTQIIF